METRSCEDQADSLVDHIWTNAPDRVRSHDNVVRGTSDHNMITAVIDTKERNDMCHELRKRLRKNFNSDNYRDRLSRVDWEELYRSDYVNVINDILEREIIRALEAEVLMRTIQPRKSLKTGSAMTQRTI